ncbi:winged helix-turn-helix domain-containing protein [Streptomyces sp. NPDC058092]|uniref:winged helix-turn-helix domain-containing protein n=1 Tax=Streptomyces sp. NPDC058092 TaxID=3346336 RepID=UPI0036EE9728
MTYAQGGGLTDAERAAQERIRLQAVERFEGRKTDREIAAALRVSKRSVERWRPQWCERGEAGVLSKDSPGHPRLSETQIVGLERELERGLLGHDWEDPRWTPARVKTLIDRLFHVRYTVEGTWALLKRHGWSWQQPARRAFAAFTRPGEVQRSTDCWKAARDSDSTSRQEWLATKRAEEQAAKAWAEQFDMPPLEGPAKALARGERSRHQLVTAAHTALVRAARGTGRTRRTAGQAVGRGAGRAGRTRRRQTGP